ncbi:hypothetical protein CFK41_08020 [Brachybacterium ginsengisoli]|uniref:YtxH domain-containing protein n=1 Tax=Brachybacterium ginsengisoli TaxID=1331682 RepID=A0A291GWZ0_9MICO|nr:hypothetical protein [Brachybacterium ginsengisoli]ATG54717.1 hypothetical protein CFK41_08020 [Brachybacterium ginsengisoli]
MKKFIFVAGLAIGFVVGSRMGRGPYESLERTAHRVAEDPEVQRRATQARETATKVAHDTASTVKEKGPGVASSVQGAVAGAAGSAKERLRGGSDDGAESSDLDTSDLDQDAAAVAEKSSDSASSGGDAEIGEDHPLSS